MKVINTRGPLIQIHYTYMYVYVGIPRTSQAKPDKYNKYKNQGANEHVVLLCITSKTMVLNPRKFSAGQGSPALNGTNLLPTQPSSWPLSPSSRPSVPSDTDSADDYVDAASDSDDQDDWVSSCTYGKRTGSVFCFFFSLCSGFFVWTEGTLLSSSLCYQDA